MKRMNFGCGPDIKKGWTNVDIVERPGVVVWNGMNFLKLYGYMVEPQLCDYDFILVNHVLCTMKPNDVHRVLIGLLETLKPGGKIQVIDVDILRAFSAYRSKDELKFPIEEGNLDYKLCMHLSGYGTRLSLFTEQFLQDELIHAGFSKAYPLMESEYDTRPNESLIVEAIR